MCVSQVDPSTGEPIEGDDGYEDEYQLELSEVKLLF